MSDQNDIKIAVLQNQMDNIEKKVDQGFLDINKKLDAVIETKASIWVEKAMIFVVGTAGLAVIGGIMNLVITYRK